MHVRREIIGNVWAIESEREVSCKRESKKEEDSVESERGRVAERVGQPAEVGLGLKSVGHGVSP